MPKPDERTRHRALQVRRYSRDKRTKPKQKAAYLDLKASNEKQARTKAEIGKAFEAFDMSAEKMIRRARWTKEKFMVGHALWVLWFNGMSYHDISKYVGRSMTVVRSMIETARSNVDACKDDPIRRLKFTGEISLDESHALQRFVDARRVFLAIQCAPVEKASTPGRQLDEEEREQAVRRYGELLITVQRGAGPKGLVEARRMACNEGTLNAGLLRLVAVAIDPSIAGEKAA